MPLFETLSVANQHAEGLGKRQDVLGGEGRVAFVMSKCRGDRSAASTEWENNWKTSTFATLSVANPKTFRVDKTYVDDDNS